MQKLSTLAKNQTNSNWDDAGVFFKQKTITIVIIDKKNNAKKNDVFKLCQQVPWKLKIKTTQNCLSSAKFSRSPMIEKRSKIIISSLIFPPKKNNAFLNKWRQKIILESKQQLMEVDVKKRKMKMI